MGNVPGGEDVMPIDDIVPDDEDMCDLDKLLLDDTRIFLEDITDDEAADSVTQNALAADAYSHPYVDAQCQSDADDDNDAASAVSGSSTQPSSNDDENTTALDKILAED